MVPIQVLQYSPLYWTDPEKFDPERLATFNLDLTLYRPTPLFRTLLGRL